MMRIANAVLLVIWCACPAIAAPKALPDAVYQDKVQGAWLGKCIGGALGMPIESWRYWDIEKNYPNITGYLGYFDDRWVGWSGVVKAESIPTNGEWRHVRVVVRVPDFDAARVFAVPIIGMSHEYSKSPACWEIRGVRIVRPKSDITFSPEDWVANSASSWQADNVVRFDFDGSRSWARMRTQSARKLQLKPGDSVLLIFEARWISGDSRIGFAFDYDSVNSRKGFKPDDDTTYQIVGLHALETYGPGLTAAQIGREWCAHLPSVSNKLAEGIALERMRSGIEPPKSGEHEIGEAIGGQMKGEIWGLICPGRPDLAAEYARRDGVVAHCRNGVYGEQFIAAMMSAAFHEKSIPKLIETGLSAIPNDSKYAEVIREVVATHARGTDWREVRKIVVDKYPGICNPVYSEAALVTLALLYGDGDFEKSINIAARCGNDTDCNAASVGALIGCIHGARAIPTKWKEPIGDSFRCFASGMEEWRISDLAKRICAAGRKTLEYHGDGVRFAEAK